MLDITPNKLYDLYKFRQAKKTTLNSNKKVYWNNETWGTKKWNVEFGRESICVLRKMNEFLIFTHNWRGKNDDKKRGNIIVWLLYLDDEIGFLSPFSVDCWTGWFYTMGVLLPSWLASNEMGAV